MNKYGARRTEVDNIVFDSRKEAARYIELKAMSQGKAISGLMVHPVFHLVVNGHRIGKYIADFQYWEDGMLVVEDVKGVKTPVYRLKKKIIKATLGIDILET